MRLELGSIPVSDVVFGPRTQLDGGVLTVSQEELSSLVLQDERLRSVSWELVKPGDSARIIPVKDVIEPRVKAAGTGTVFPGLIGKVDTVGSGRTHVLKGVAVVTTGGIAGFQEGIIDMSGPGADYTPFAATINLVMVAEPMEGVDQYDHEQALRLAGLKVAAHLGETARGAAPSHLEVYETAPVAEAHERHPGLPKVVYVYMLQSQGLLHDTYVYGVDVKKLLPTFLFPTEVMDGAIVSGNCVSACDKNTTYHHLNNPVIEDLYAHHGRDLNFLGVVITNENVTLADKERSSNYTAQLVEFLGAEGAIITEEGFGNPDTDLMMNCAKLERKGIKTVLITDEYAGRDGASQSLADASPLADAVVTTGNANEVITLPPMDRVIGHPRAADSIAGGSAGSLRADGSISVELQAIIGATNELGFNRLTARPH